MLHFYNNLHLKILSDFLDINSHNMLWFKSQIKNIYLILQEREKA